jgi:hypothetical protein
VFKEKAENFSNPCCGLLIGLGYLLDHNGAGSSRIFCGFSEVSLFGFRFFYNDAFGKFLFVSFFFSGFSLQVSW